MIGRVSHGGGDYSACGAGEATAAAAAASEEGRRRRRLQAREAAAGQLPANEASG